MPPGGPSWSEFLGKSASVVGRDFLLGLLSDPLVLDVADCEPERRGYRIVDGGSVACPRLCEVSTPNSNLRSEPRSTATVYAGMIEEAIRL